MKPPVCGIIVLGLALGTHGKIFHGGGGPVIGNLFNYGETRPTVGAVDKRIAVASVCGIKELFQTFSAGSYIRRDEDELALLLYALSDSEIGEARRRI
jgi:hypothetical protein